MVYIVVVVIIFNAFINADISYVKYDNQKTKTVMYFYILCVYKCVGMSDSLLTKEFYSFVISILPMKT